MQNVQRRLESLVSNELRGKIKTITFTGFVTI
jgi:hypothetical protein